MIKNLLRILIIEDNIDHVELLSQVIERHYAPVDLHTVESIEDALDFIEQTEYNLVLTDLYINDASIVSQIPTLRAKLKDVPIIVITGSGDEALAAEVIKKGANDYLVKSKDSLEKVPLLINKYTKKSSAGGASNRSRKPKETPIREKILDEVTSLGKQAKHMATHPSGRIPDLKQLESLLDQIQRLKDLASKLMDK
jgi:DNA-binding NtrC family response regulator